MADFGSNMKKIWLKGMEAIGNTASNIASNTRSKVDEMNLVTRRSEILKEFGNQAYSLWQKGERFPEELEKQEKWQEMTIEEHMEYYENQGVSHKDAMKKVAADRGVGKREIYQELLKSQENQ